MTSAGPLILIRGGGDLATGVAARLHRSGFAVIVTEIAQPLAVRRLVALAQAVYAGDMAVEELHSRRVEGEEEALRVLDEGVIPVVVDAEARIRQALPPLAIVDGRMLKQAQSYELEREPLVIGLGPGFKAGVNCQAVVETKRGHAMGRVRWEGSAEADTGVPDPVSGHALERVLRAPAAGQVLSHAALGSLVKKGDLIATLGEADLAAPFDGALRGLLHDGVHVEKGAKVGDLDPRGRVEFCYEISDKALAIGGGVLEALLSQAEIRRELGS